MNRFVRTVVTWLLLLALPVHGFAASTMLLCGAEHHGAAQVGGAEHHHADHRHGDTSGAVGAYPSHADHNLEVAATAARDPGAIGAMAAKHAKGVGKCSACAACCAVAFLPASDIAFSAPAPSQALPAVELSAHIGFVAGGPDKPPRIPFA